jgi:hypothetical protein
LAGRQVEKFVICLSTFVDCDAIEIPPWINTSIRKKENENESENDVCGVAQIDIFPMLYLVSLIRDFIYLEILNLITFLQDFFSV